VACSSSGEEQPSPALEGSASGEQEASENNSATDKAAEGGEGANANAAAANNPVGNELNNAIAGDKAAENPANAAPEVGAINAEANGNAAAAVAGDSAATPNPAVDANAGNPFANTAPANGNAAAPAANALPAAPDSTGAAAVEPSAPVNTADSASSAPTGPSSLPEVGSKMAYYVMRGDTLGTISEKIYGSKKKWKSLQQMNGLADPNKIYPGDVIYFTLDESSKAFAEKYELGTRQSYTVAKNDTLSQLAQKFYGTQGAWRTLWKENPQIKNPDLIRVGMVLSFRSDAKVALKEETSAEEGVKAETVSAPNTDSETASTGLGIAQETTPSEVSATAVTE
jgi:nucleoid-associated protein YgaU